jgi:hypothetical protein
MGLANINFTDTFDQWRTKTNQIILYSNEQNLQLNLAFDTTNASFNVANSSFGKLNTAFQVTNSAYVLSNGNFVNVNSAYTVANAGYNQANTARDKANDAYSLALTLGGDTANIIVDLQNNYTLINASFTVANNAANKGNDSFLLLNTAFNVTNASFARANAALPNTSGAMFDGNLFFPTGNVGIGVTTTNNKLEIDGTLRVSSNVFLGGRKLETANNLMIGNTTSVIFVDQQNTRVGVGTSTPSVALDVSGSAVISSTLTVNGMAYTGITTNAASAFGAANQSGVISNAAFNHANSSFSTANLALSIANDLSLEADIFDRANGSFRVANAAFDRANGGLTVASAAFGAANGKVTSVSGVAGRVTSSGGTTPTIDLSTAGAGAASYSSGISAITVDAYGRVTSVSGSAGYLTGITSGQVLGALGYTPYNSSNPSGFITSSASITGSASTFTSTTQNSRFNSIGVNTAASGSAGEIRATDNIIAYFSDKRLKDIISPITNPIDKIKQLSGILYRNNELAASLGYKDKSEQVGVIAQDVEKVMPQIVRLAPFDTEFVDGKEVSISGKNYKTVQYEKLIPLLIESIKELSREIEELKARGN